MSPIPSQDEYEAGLESLALSDDGSDDTTPAAAAPETTDSAPADAAAQPEDAASGPPRDEKGRFAPKASDAPSDEAQPPSPPAAATPPVPTPETVAVPEVTTPAAPFMVRAGGKEHTIDWLTPGPNGAVVVPADKLADFRQLVSEAITRRTVDREDRVRSAQTIKQLQAQVQQRSAEQTTATQLVEALATLPPEQAWAALHEFRDEFPKLQVQWERDRNKQLLEQIARGEMPADLPGQPSEPTPPDEASRSQALSDAVAEAKQFVPGADTLTEQDWAAVQHFAEFAGEALFRKVTEQEAMAHGLTAGQYVFDGPRYAKIVAQRVQDATDRKKVLDAAAKAAEQNARAAQHATQQVPPAGGATSRSTPAPKVAPKASSKTEWEQSLAELATKD